MGWLGRSLSLGGPFTIVKMGTKRRERPFRRRVAKVGVTKYRILHGSSAGAQPPHRRSSHSPAVTHAARNPTEQALFQSSSRFESAPTIRRYDSESQKYVFFRIGGLAIRRFTIQIAIQKSSTSKNDPKMLLTRVQNDSQMIPKC